MCGIIGYLGKQNAQPILIEGLKRMEYRGYDSAGLALLDKSQLSIHRSLGKVNNLDSLPMKQANIGIAHTRWATHGKPSELNAHPHTDCTKHIALVHNGIIENHRSLRQLLISEGHQFYSDTDTEVLSHLIEKFYQGDLEHAVSKALKLVEGTYGLAVIHNKEQRIVAARLGSPLMLGIGQSEWLIASDAAAILPYTKEVIYLDDHEIASITQTVYSIKNLDGQNVEKSIEQLALSISEIEKNGYPHFMLKEIFEQPESVANCLLGRFDNGQVKVTLNIDQTRIKRVLILACGSSYHAGLIGKYYLESLSKLPTEVDYASEFRYRDPLDLSDILVVAISQSGETADTIEALKSAKSRGAQTIGLVNVVGSTIARQVGSGIYLHAGPEIGVASTKALTTQLVAVLLLALYLHHPSIETKSIIDSLNKLPDNIRQILKLSDKIRTIAISLAHSENFLYLGRGLYFPVALEGALKLKEISYIHAEGYPAAEMKHGPIALIDQNMPVVFLLPSGPLYQKALSNLMEVHSRGGRIICMTDQAEDVKDLAEFIIPLPKLETYISPILHIIPLQLLAYYIADEKGLDVDKPRNLAKSVTVE